MPSVRLVTFIKKIFFKNGIDIWRREIYHFYQERKDDNGENFDEEKAI